MEDSGSELAPPLDLQVADLSMGDLLLHTSVIWLNPPASLGKWKKEPELAAFGKCQSARGGEQLTRFPNKNIPFPRDVLL